jgi:hypothetical protein
MLRFTQRLFSKKGPHREMKRERVYRQGIKDTQVTNFTNHVSFTEHLKEKEKAFKRTLGHVKLSTVVNSERKLKKRPFFNSSLKNTAKFARFANKAMRKQVGTKIDDIYEDESASLRNKFFALDHTAEVLENYRRIQENKIFTAVLHSSREKKAFLKNESRELQSILSPQNHQKFISYQDNKGLLEHTEQHFVTDSLHATSE